jgi:curved DNA-binding protein CbpA
MKRKSPYDVLNVDKNATKDEIKKSFRELAKNNHPDQGGSTDRMSEITNAYRLLSDETKRKQYDETGEYDDTIDKEISEVYNLFFTICENVFLQRENIPIKENINNLKSSIETQNKAELEKCENMKKLIKSARKRIIKKPKNDLIESLFEQRMKEIEINELKVNNQMEINKKAFALFEGYVFDDKVKEQMNSFSFVLPNGVFFNSGSAGNT